MSKLFFTPEDLAKFDYKTELNDPGQYPYTRGIYPTMYKGKLWTMRQYAGFSTAEETNERYKYLLNAGQTGLSVAFDLPTQLGLDADHPLSKGEVGRVGVSISTLSDMEVLFNDIPLDKVSTSMTINATAPILLGMYILIAEKDGIQKSTLRGTVQNDLLKEFLARGNYIYPVTPSVKISIDLWEYAMRNVPKWYFVSISGYHIREAGATAAQELALTFSNAIAYVEAALSRGLNVDDFAPRISFFFGVHNNFLEEVAKFRAARKIWAEIMKKRFKAKLVKSMQLRFHTQTCGSTLTAQEPENNIVRVALQSLAAVFGGTQSLHTNSYDEAIGLPSEKSVKIALRTQQLIAYESGIPEFVDPFGGSYCVEKLTEDIEEETRAIMKDIEERGGAIECINLGYSHSLIEDSAYKYQKEIETNKRKVIGINMFQEDVEIPPPSLRVNPEIEEKRKKELAKYKESRDNIKLKDSLSQLKDAAEKNKNLTEPIIDSIRNKATLGEITEALKEMYGTYDEQ